MVSNPAGFWIRLLANILDGIIIGLPLGIISYFIAGDMEGDIFTNVLSLLYAVVLPVIWMGYTIGKKITGVRIVKINGKKLGIGSMLLRAVVSGIVYMVTFGIGLLISAFMVGLRSDKRSIHDMIAGTYVTKDTP